MVSRLYLLVVTVLLLGALAVTLPVILDILREGLERRRNWNGDEVDSDEAETNPPGGGAREEPMGIRQCPHCGAENDADFTFCQQCAEPL